VEQRDQAPHRSTGEMGKHGATAEHSFNETQNHHKRQPNKRDKEKRGNNTTENERKIQHETRRNNTDQKEKRQLDIRGGWSNATQRDFRHHTFTTRSHT
jgi:hypothetical protein